MDLTDEQWYIIQPLIPNQPRRPDGKGRPWKDARDVMNAVLWILRTGAPSLVWYARSIGTDRTKHVIVEGSSTGTY